MKTKVFFALSICCFLVSLGFLVGLTTSTGVKAQVAERLMNTLDVRLAEDFMQEHGKQLFNFSEKRPIV